MKICFVTQTYPRDENDVSGPFIRCLAHHLVERGLEVHCLLPEVENFKLPLNDKGVKLHLFKYAPSKGLHCIGYGRTMFADIKIKLLPKLMAPFYVFFGTIALIRLIFKGNIDIIHAHCIVPNGAVGRWASFSTKKPLIATLHGTDAFIYRNSRLVRSLITRVDAITSVSPLLLESVIKYRKVKYREKFIIPYGVDSKEFILKSHNRKNDNIIIGSLGRLCYKKGFLFLVDAAKKLKERGCKNFKIFIGGQGGLRDELLKRIREYELQECVILKGIIKRDIILEFYHNCDIFTLPSIVDDYGNVDGLPNVILEAMACGLPVVSTNISGIPLAVDDGLNGILVPQRDSTKLADAFMELIQNEGLRKEMGKRAREKAEKELSWDCIAQKYEQIYTDILSYKRSNEIC